MADSGSRRLALLTSAPASGDGETASEQLIEPGLADVVTLQRRAAARVRADDEHDFFLDTLAEYLWARDVAGLAAGTLDQLTKPVVEISEHYGVAAWRLTPREVDRYATRGWARNVGADSSRRRDTAT